MAPTDGSKTKQLISKKTINEFVEHMSGWHNLRTIKLAFDAAEIAQDETHEPDVSGQRRALALQYLHTLDLTKWPDTRRLLNVCEDLLHQLEDQAESTFNTDNAKTELARLVRVLRRGGFTYEDGRIVAYAAEPLHTTLVDVAFKLNSDYLQQQIQTMQQAVDMNPALAIGTAKELIETACKTILDERGASVEGNPDIPKLVKQTMKALKLTPDDVPDAAKGADTIRRMLSNLATVAQGLSELRNPYGSGHGKHANTKGLGPRHARLAVGAASTLAVFLFETHEERP